MDTKVNTKIVVTGLVGVIVGAGVATIFGMGMNSKTEVAMAPEGAMSMTASLEEKRGDDFDREFLAQMTLHHEDAIEMSRLALKDAKRPEIKELAQSIIDTQNEEIAQMKQWQGEWFASEGTTLDMEHSNETSPVAQ